MTVVDLTRELLVRQLETWAPAALHRARRAVYLHAYADAGGAALVEAALRVFTEQSDLVRGRELTMVAVADDPAPVRARLDAVGSTAAGLTVHAVGGGPDAVPVALRAAGAAGVPVLGFLDAVAAGQVPDAHALAALAVGKPTELLLTLPAGTPGHRELLEAAGYALVAAVELVGAAESALLVFGTGHRLRLEAFKEALWAVDEFAGVQYRDPRDPDGHLIDVSLAPHPGPLRRELLTRLEAGPATVTDLRTYALTDTVYRAVDATRVLQSLVIAGAVHREPAHGRFGGDVTISRS